MLIGVELPARGAFRVPRQLPQPIDRRARRGIPRHEQSGVRPARPAPARARECLRSPLRPREPDLALHADDRALCARRPLDLGNRTLDARALRHPRSGHGRLRRRPARAGALPRPGSQRSALDPRHRRVARADRAARMQRGRGRRGGHHLSRARTRRLRGAHHEG